MIEKLHQLACPVEQVDADVFLDCLDPARECRSGQVPPLGRLAERTGF
ncbi:MAG: hypothetical protein M5U35_10375 [Roseovarius sp.]|nr:hypothetical protein [Roseovarius sp.]